MTGEATADAADGILLASRTDVGQVRSANEDSCDVFERADGTRLLVVADGMGGHRGGATASRTAVEAIGRVFEDERGTRHGAMLGQAVQAANQQVYEQARADPELEGMGTTVVAFVLDDRLRAHVAHVGDSRAYRYRRGEIAPLTIDHSVVAEMQRRGLLSNDEAAVHPRRNEILRSVGVLPDVEVEVAEVEARAGDRFVLCSDGLSGVVTDDEIAAVVQSETPQGAVDALIAMANERGGPDNISVQVLAIPAGEPDGDPEATAPVELSAVGIEAIEAKRRSRRRRQRLLIALVLVLAVAGVVLALRALGRGDAEAPSPQAAPRPSSDASPATEDPPIDRFEATPPAERRRGVPSGSERVDPLARD